MEESVLQPSKQKEKDYRKLMATSKEAQRVLVKAQQRTKIVHGVEKVVWSDQDRLKAVSTYLATGNLLKTARLLNIPLDTVREWKYRTTWWKELENMLKDEQNDALAATATDIVEASMKALQDRLKNGDYVYNVRTGEVSRVQVKARDLANIANTMVEKKLVLHKQPSRIVAKEQDVLEDKLNKLASAFKKFGKKGEVEVEGEVVIDSPPQVEDKEM